MRAYSKLTIALAMTLSGASAVHAAPTGVQWTPDATKILVNKDVGNERWAITLDLSDVSATGNVFFLDDRAPSFIWCEKTGHDFDAGAGEITLQYRCFGSDRAIGGFAFDDWSIINEEVFLPASFFVPEAETCDISGSVNGPNAGNGDSFWQCEGNGGNFEFQLFSNGTGNSTAPGVGPFEFDVFTEGCRFARLGDGSFLDVEDSPSRDRITIYEVPQAVDRFIVSECERKDF
jgi:hypothetical protein